MNSDFSGLSNLLSSLKYDIGSLLSSVFLMAVYYFFLSRKVRKNPFFTVQAINRIARTAWVETGMHDSKEDVLAVQTLRNSTMASTFLASTSILLIIGVLALSEQGGKLEAVWHALNLAGDFYSTGMRAYYFLVPLVFWLFSPVFMLVSTVILIVALYRTDRAPKLQEMHFSDIRK